MTDTTRWGAGTPLPAIEALDAVDSTNAWLLARGRAGALHGAAVRARVQTAGRGRRDHRWMSPEGGLYLSVLVRPQLPTHQLPGLPVACGLGVLAGLRELGYTDTLLKWPNDVLADGAKLAGILVETGMSEAGTFAVCGVGVNRTVPQLDGWCSGSEDGVRPAGSAAGADGVAGAASPGARRDASDRSAAFRMPDASASVQRASASRAVAPVSGASASETPLAPSNTATDAQLPFSPASLPPTGLAAHLAAGMALPSVEACAAAVRAGIVAAVDAWCAGLREAGAEVPPLTGVLDAYNARLAYRGEAVAVLAADGGAHDVAPGARLDTGVLLGIDAQGCALVRTGDEEPRAYASSQVSLRPLS